MDCGLFCKRTERMKAAIGAWTTLYAFSDARINNGDGRLDNPYIRLRNLKQEITSRLGRLPTDDKPSIQTLLINLSKCNDDSNICFMDKDIKKLVPIK